MHGIIDIGYEINRQRNFVLRFSHNVVIGSYNCSFNQRCIFVYRAKSECKGYFIRKQHWLDILNSDAEISDYIKNNVRSIYLTTIKKKVMAVKEQHIKRIQDRKDLKHLILISDKNPKSLETRNLLIGGNDLDTKKEDEDNLVDQAKTTFKEQLGKLSSTMADMVDRMAAFKEQNLSKDAEIQKLRAELKMERELNAQLVSNQKLTESYNNS